MAKTLLLHRVTMWIKSCIYIICVIYKECLMPIALNRSTIVNVSINGSLSPMPTS